MLYQMLLFLFDFLMRWLAHFEGIEVGTRGVKGLIESSQFLCYRSHAAKSSFEEERFF